MKNVIKIVAFAVLLSACDTEPKQVEVEPRSESVKPIVNKYPTAEEKKNKRIAMGFYEAVVNKHNVEAIDSFASPNYLEHQYDTHYDSDRKGIKKAFNDYFIAFPDIQVKVNFMMAEGDLVTAQITTTGTNLGPIYKQKATKKKFEIEGVDIIRFKNGKVEKHWGYAEEGKLLTQLGLIRSLIKEGRKEKREAAQRKEKKVFPDSSK